MFSNVRVEITLLLVGRAVLYLPQLRKLAVCVHYGENVTVRGISYL